MKSLFIYHWLFRLLSPIFSGVAIYALILLTYGDLDSLFESIQTPELYLCIALAFITQELTIMLLRRINKTLFLEIKPVKIILAAGRIMVIGLIAASFSLSFYYQFFLGYLPAQEELVLFNTLYAILLLLYIIIYISHGILEAMAQQRIDTQLSIKKTSEEDFNRFIQDINPELLTSSLESVISNLHVDEDKADHTVITLSRVYRYMISKRKQQLVTINEEVEAAKQLIELYNDLPYCKAELKYTPSDGNIIPGTLVHLIEQIFKCTIPNTEATLLIDVYEENGFIYTSYETNDKLDDKICVNQLNDLKQQYATYTERTINVTKLNDKRSISIPKLIITT